MSNGGRRRDYRGEDRSRDNVEQREERESIKRDEIVIRIPPSKFLTIGPKLFHNKVTITFVELALRGKQRPGLLPSTNHRGIDWFTKRPSLTPFLSL